MGGHFLRKPLTASLLHLLIVPLRVHDPVELNAVSIKQKFQVSLRPKGRRIDPHFKPPLLKFMDQLYSPFAKSFLEEHSVQPARHRLNAVSPRIYKQDLIEVK